MRPNIVLFGDSITEHSFGNGGWGASLANSFSRQADIIVRGYSGYNTRWALFLLHRIFPLGTTNAPIATTVFFGANDAALSGRTCERQHVPIQEYKDNLRKIVNHLKACSSKMVVIIITPPPINEEGRLEYARLKYGERASTIPERTNEATGDYAKTCVQLGSEVGVPVIDLWSKMQETEGWKTKFLRDGLHLTEEGCDVVYSEVERSVRAYCHHLPHDFPFNNDIDWKNPEKSFSL